MSTISRRRLAVYGATQLLEGHPVKQVAKDLSVVLLASGRSKELDLLIADIAWELEDRGVVAQATVTTSSPLSDSLRQNIAKFIKQSVGVKGVVLKESIDKSVLGGVRIETSSHEWDRTISKKLTAIKEAF